MDRLTERLAVAEKALATLVEALENTALPDIECRDVCILRFVYTFEATWKAAQSVLREHHGVVANTPVSIVRACVTAGVLTETMGEAALGMVKDRNMAANTYNEDLARRLGERLPSHAETMRGWLVALKAT